MSLPLVTGVAPRWETHIATLVSASTEVHLVRRCADVAELVGVAAAGLARVVIVSADLRGVDRSVLEALTGAGALVLAVHAPGDEAAARSLRRWGVRVVRPADLDREALDEAVDELTRPTDEPGPASDPARPGTDRGHRDAAPPHRDPAAGHPGAAAGHAAEDAGRVDAGQRPAAGRATGRDDGPPRATTLVTEADGLLDEELRRLVAEATGVDGGGPDEPSGPPPEGSLPEGAPPGPEGVGEAHRDEPGRIIAVWGAYGSPGRTTVAVNLAAELATVLEPVLLVDADTYAASVAQTLAVLDEAPGIAAACRAADQGTLDRETLAALAPEVRPGLRILTGLPRADRWPEIRDSALADVLEQARELARWVVVDIAPVLEQDEELSFDTSAPRRNGAALTVLDAADRVLVVGSGDPLGLQRLVRALDALGEHTRVPRRTVVTRVRPGPVGPEPGRRIQEALARFAGASDVCLVPEDREGLDAALLHGQALCEVRTGSPARQAIRTLAHDLAGRESRREGRRRRAGWRRSARTW